MMSSNNRESSRQDFKSTSDHVSDMVVNTDSSFETTSNPPRSHESFSLFGDSACGEPLSPQHLMLDFTPIEELDNDYVQRKCCAFWDFLNSRTDLHGLMVLPESNLYDLTGTSSVPSLTPDDAESASEKVSLAKEITAVSMLEFVEGKGLINRTFEAKLPRTTCSLGSREYLGNETSAVQKHISHKREECKCKDVCKSCLNYQPTVPPESSPDVQLMCSNMTEWDKKHPKSMAPPGHPPALSYCTMQRKIVS